MARVTFVDLTPEQEELYWGALAPGDRYTIPKIRRKNVFYGKRKKLQLAGRSLLSVIANSWQNFNQAEKDAWTAAGAKRNCNGWQAFVADQAKRLKLEMPGTATPSLLHQNHIGGISIDAPAEECHLVQFHPSQYYVYQKIAGTKDQYEPVSVTESFALPFKIGLSYKTDMTSTGSGSFIKFYAKIRHLYQGQNLETDLEISMPLQSDWAEDDETQTELIGLAVSYNLYIHAYKVRGDMWFDNIVAEHSGQNWARDPYCKDISKAFTKAYAQIPQNWAGLVLPEGAWYNSVYPGEPI